MGCILGKACDPSAPDDSVRQVWHIQRVTLMAVGKIQNRRAGIIYIENGALWYRSRRCDCRKSGDPMRIELGHITGIRHSEKIHLSQDESKATIGCFIVIDVESSESCLQVIFTAANAQQIISEIQTIVDKHRQKPRILQFNSVDLEGVEIECP